MLVQVHLAAQASATDGRLAAAPYRSTAFLRTPRSRGDKLVERDQRRFCECLLEVHPLQKSVERRTQRLSPICEAVLHLGRDLVMNEAPDDAISFHLAQLLINIFSDTVGIARRNSENRRTLPPNR